MFTIKIITVFFIVLSAFQVSAKTITNPWPCQQDAQKICPDSKGMLAMKICLKKNKDKLTKNCLNQLEPAKTTPKTDEPDCDEKEKKKEEIKKVDDTENCEPEMLFEEIKPEE